ncbi:MAG TPA: S-methyl-5-thioribose-1-phosphate isomerase [Longimicrobium sp.]|jgi:methylthioribose-1-phosphate isomerase|uniref:S-methyl-5-thioribose-1-phosphate isomerase n=1 Tax=Longimicrobium sp. TaxID=2029185 RepID=UPI002ED9602D
MRVNGTPYRTVWMEGGTVHLIDQNRLPFAFALVECADHRATAEAIRDMTVRGAPAIGAAAAYALAQAFAEAPADDPWPYVRAARAFIEATRPTARDLFHGTEQVWSAAEAATGPALRPKDYESPALAGLDAARALAEESVACCRRIGEHGATLVPEGARVLTHCNAGWLATVDYGTALAPVYAAAAAGRRPHVWVDETRPRAQGARLTAWELAGEGIAHSVIADNAAAFLMSRGEVDLVIVGADRIAANGDVVNKVGTLAKAVCAKEFGVPFYVAAPPSTFDASVPGGASVTIEERSEDEVHFQSGPDDEGTMRRIRVTSPGCSARNPAFDVTPARLVTAYVTELGIFPAGALPADVFPAAAPRPAAV